MISKKFLFTFLPSTPHFFDWAVLPMEVNKNLGNEKFNTTLSNGKLQEFGAVSALLLFGRGKIRVAYCQCSQRRMGQARTKVQLCTR